MEMAKFAEMLAYTLIPTWAWNKIFTEPLVRVPRFCLLPRSGAVNCIVNNISSVLYCNAVPSVNVQLTLTCKVSVTVNIKIMVFWDVAPYGFQARLHNREKRLLASCPSVGPHVSAPLPVDVCPWNWMLGTFMKICRENPSMVKTGKNIGHLTWRRNCVLLLPAT
jgi:hypothetical protein